MPKVRLPAPDMKTWLPAPRSVKTEVSRPLLPMLWLRAMPSAPTTSSPSIHQVCSCSVELTAIVLSGAAGLRIGHALVAPDRLTRLQSLVLAARDSAVLLYGVTAMLLVAAAVEAFWSSAIWLPPAAKYASALVCWTAVLGYLTF